jgi:hypothetical protein
MESTDSPPRCGHPLEPIPIGDALALWCDICKRHWWQTAPVDVPVHEGVIGEEPD